MAERYCVPTSQNCRFGVMGSMFFQNTSRSLRVGDFRRIVNDFDRFCVAGAPRGNLLVRGILRAPARVAGSRRDDARQLIERRLHAPETAAGKRRLLVSRVARLPACSLWMGNGCHSEQAPAINPIRIVRLMIFLNSQFTS